MEELKVENLKTFHKEVLTENEERRLANFISKVGGEMKNDYYDFENDVLIDMEDELRGGLFEKLQAELLAKAILEAVRTRKNIEKNFVYPS